MTQEQAPRRLSSVGFFMHSVSLPSGLNEALNFPTFSDEEIRNSLELEVKKHKYWRSSAIHNMKIIEIESTVALRYTLESFIESRVLFSASEPASVMRDDDFIDCKDVWDIPCKPTQMFEDEVKEVILPGTSQITVCTSCNGAGSNLCFHCRGSGTVRCTACNGTGMRSGIPHPAVTAHPLVAALPHGNTSRGYPSSSVATAKSRSRGSFGVGTPAHLRSVTGIPPPGISIVDLCAICTGTGLCHCSHCNGAGNKTCSVCQACGQVRSVLKMKAKFTLVKSEYCHEPNVPENMLSKVTGETVLVECQPIVKPIRNFPVSSINEESLRLVKAHLQMSSENSKILKQRQMLEAVPVAEVTYEINRRIGKFWVLGQERLAYVPQYPKKCCIL